jgi:hypothetical protein
LVVKKKKKNITKLVYLIVLFFSPNVHKWCEITENAVFRFVAILDFGCLESGENQSD